MATKLEICLVCDDVRVEQNGKQMLIGLFDQFNLADITKPVPPFKIFGRIAFDSAGEHELRVRITSEDGGFSTGTEGRLGTDMRSPVTERYEATFNVGVMGLRLPRLGRYRVRIIVDGEELGGCGFVVQHAETAAGDCDR